MIGKVLLFAGFCFVAVSAEEWEWKKNPHAVECQKKVMGDHWDDTKVPCMMVCVGHKDGYFHEDNTVDSEKMKKWINNLNVDQDKKDSLLKAYPECESVAKGLDECEAGKTYYKCIKEHGGHFPKFQH